MSPLVPLIGLLLLPIGGALYFMDTPILGKPKIKGKSRDEGVGLPEAEHDVDLGPDRGDLRRERQAARRARRQERKDRLYLSVIKPPSV